MDIWLHDNTGSRETTRKFVARIGVVRRRIVANHTAEANSTPSFARLDL